MSFILDALKKSENERQRHIGPSLADVQFKRRHGERPWWMVAVAGLLFVNLAVLAIVLLRAGGEDPVAPSPIADDRSPAPVAEISPRAAPRPALSAPVRRAQTVPTNPAVRSLADEAAEYDPLLDEEPPPPDLAMAAAVPDGPAKVRQIEPPAVAPASARSSAAARAAAEDEILPTHGALIASGTSLPALHLDIHVHSKDPAARFVFINMRKYVEGQALNEGPELESITGDGAVLNQRGLRFLLPRQ